MALKLRVISEQHQELGRHASRLFGVSGGRIGRARDNDWVLPDPQRYISAHHCEVSFRAGDWVLKDTSTNGVFVNEAVMPLQGEQILSDGDVLRLGEYLLQVSIDERNDFSPDASGQLPVSMAPGRRALAPGEDQLGSSLDFGALLSDDLSGESAAGPAPVLGPSTAARPARTLIPTLSPSDRPNMTNPGLSLVPDEVPLTDAADEGQQSTVAHNRTPDDWLAPARLAPRRNGAPESGVEAFCRGAGLDPASLSAQARAELLSAAGQMMREVVLGLMDLLKARTDSKGQLRLNQTAIRPSDNNPLKFSASVDEALVKLLNGQHASYLGPAETIRASFGDLRTHHSALNASLRVAMDEFMTRIEPSELTERFDRGLKRGALLGAANKMKYWELYTEFYQVLNLRNEEDLPTVFADDLARAYAEHVTQKKR